MFIAQYLNGKWVMSLYEAVHQHKMNIVQDNQWKWTTTQMIDKTTIWFWMANNNNNNWKVLCLIIGLVEQ